MNDELLKDFDDIVMADWKPFFSNESKAIIFNQLKGARKESVSFLYFYAKKSGIDVSRRAMGNTLRLFVDWFSYEQVNDTYTDFEDDPYYLTQDERTKLKIIENLIYSLPIELFIFGMGLYSSYKAKKDISEFNVWGAAYLPICEIADISRRAGCLEGFASKSQQSIHNALSIEKIREIEMKSLSNRSRRNAQIKDLKHNEPKRIRINRWLEKNRNNYIVQARAIEALFSEININAKDKDVITFSMCKTETIKWDKADLAEQKLV